MTTSYRGSDGCISQKQLFRSSYHSNYSVKPKQDTAALVAPAKEGSSAVASRNALQRTSTELSNIDYSSSDSIASSTAAIIGFNSYGDRAEFEPDVDSITGAQLEQCEIFYVSPTKRKASTTKDVTTPPFRSCEHTNVNDLSASAIVSGYGTRTPHTHEAGVVGDTLGYSFNNCDTLSHYSDTVVQMPLSNARVNGSASSNNLEQQHSMKKPNSQDDIRFGYQSQSQQPQKQQSVSLRRSNLSLCSCDAGANTEINPNPLLPLCEYSMKRRPKGHTYTCEQNAQILLRLQRERNRKLSLNGGEKSRDNDEVQGDISTSSEEYVIPPVPPPPSKKPNSRMQNFGLTQAQQSPLSSCSTNSNNNTFISFLNVEGLKKCIDDPYDTSLKQCTHLIGADAANNADTTTNKLNRTNSGLIATNTSQDRRYAEDYPQVFFSKYGSPYARDDICTPCAKKSDPLLCFLKTNCRAVGDEPRKPTKSQHHLQRNRSFVRFKKYNTIGPNFDDYTRHLRTQYGLRRQLQQQQPRTSNSCSCLSQSFSSFSQGHFGQLGPSNSRSGTNMTSSLTRCDNQSDLLSHAYKERNWLKHEPTPPFSANHSCSNLIDENNKHDPINHMKYGFHANVNVFRSNCSIDAAASLLKNASFTTLSSSKSGLTEKLHQHVHNYENNLHEHAKEQQRGYNYGKHKYHLRTTPQQKHLHSSIASIIPWKHRQCPSRSSSSSGTNSFQFDAVKHWLAVSSILLIIGAASVAVPLALRVAASAPFEERLRVAMQLLDQVPLIDGHNDLPWNIRKFLHNKINDFNFDEDLRNVMPWARSQWSHTDLHRLKKGRISAQFWAAYVPCEAQHRDAVQLTLEQIDVIKRLTDRYSPQLTSCTSSDDIIEAHKNHQMCSLTGVEGGHSLGGSLAVLRTLYAIGVRYLTLTSTCHTPWADSSSADAPTFNVKHGGLTIFGKTIIREMNRLGMMVDLSHVSTGTMRDALEVSEAPVIFSHSSAYEICNSSRNVQDDMLQSLAKNGGLIMVNFYSKFLTCSENSTVQDAVDHINHIKRVAGIDHVGLGAGYDGINFTPKDLEDVSSYPTLFAELLGGGWSIDDLSKLASGNFLRVMKQVEKIRDEKLASGLKPYEDHPNFRTDDPYNCTSS